MTDPIFWLKPESGENPWIPLELNKQVSVGRRDVVAEESRPINSISRVQAVVTAVSKSSVQLKQLGGNTMYLTTGDHAEPLKLVTGKEYMLKLGDKISLSGKCYVYRLVAPHSESRDLTRSTSTLAPEVYSDDTDRDEEARDMPKLGNDPSETDKKSVKQSLTPTEEVSHAVLHGDQQESDAKNSDSEHKEMEIEPKTQKGKKRKSRKDSADEVAEDADWDPSRDKKKRKKDSSTNKESDATPTRGTRPQRARVTWISKYVDQIALRGYSFSERHKLAILYDEVCLTHITPEWHLEKPERLQYILSGIEELRKVVTGTRMVVKVNDLPNLASDQLNQIHSEAYLAKMKARVSRSLSFIPQHATQLSQEQSRDSDAQDTFVSRHSLDAALASASAVCRAVDIVLADHVSQTAEQFDSQSNTQPDSVYIAPLDEDLAQVRHVFCAVRPPGHHAGHSGHAQAQSQGFCLINNVAVGVNYALNRGLTRVVIYDFDVHHGNGTEDIMATNQRFKDHVLFISSHCSEIYPHTGVTSPAKNIVNVPLKNRSTSAQFRKAFKEKILTTIDEYKPELIVLSAGFDAFKDDPVQCLRLDESDYAFMTEELKALAVKHCAGRLISVLEGGYDLDSLQRCVQVHLTHLMTGCAMDEIKRASDSHSVNEANKGNASASEENNNNVIVSETSMPELVERNNTNRNQIAHEHSHSAVHGEEAAESTENKSNDEH
jgi:acetoin utilization deacetylase AcuC-like enzyme